MRKLPLIAGIAAVAAFVAGIAWYSGHRGAPKDSPRVTVARTLPAFSLADTDGNVVSSSRFSGKPTVINFFATWCPPCREEIPGFVAVYDKYRDRGLEVVGIALDTDTRSSLPAFIVSNRIRYRILLGDVATVRAFDWGSAIPATFFVGRNGEIGTVHVGFMDQETFDREVQKIL